MPVCRDVIRVAAIDFPSLLYVVRLVFLKYLSHFFHKNGIAPAHFLCRRPHMLYHDIAAFLLRATWQFLKVLYSDLHRHRRSILNRQEGDRFCMEQNIKQ